LLNLNLFLSRHISFIQFLAELAKTMKLEPRPGMLENISVLGRAVLDIVMKLIEYPTDANVQCAVQVLQVRKLWAGLVSTD